MAASALVYFLSILEQYTDTRMKAAGIDLQGRPPDSRVPISWTASRLRLKKVFKKDVDWLKSHAQFPDLKSDQFSTYPLPETVDEPSGQIAIQHVCFAHLKQQRGWVSTASTLRPTSYLLDC